MIDVRAEIAKALEQARKKKSSVIHWTPASALPYRKDESVI